MSNIRYHQHDHRDLKPENVLIGRQLWGPTSGIVNEKETGYHFFDKLLILISWKRTAETKLKKVTIGCGHQRCGNNFITELFIKVGGYNVHTNQTTGTPNLIRIASHGKFKRIYITSSSSPSPCSTGNLLMKDQPYHPMPKNCWLCQDIRPHGGVLYWPGIWNTLVIWLWCIPETRVLPFKDNRMR